MKIAACYIRVSTDDQLEYSPDSQLEKIRDYAKRNDMIIPNDYIFIEEEGVSGRKAEKRREFQRMIGIAKTKPKPFDAILLWKFSRFARNREDSIVYKSMLRKQLGIEVISVSENVGDDKMSVLIEAMIEAMDEYYSINLAEEVKRGMTEKAKRGEAVSIAPFGYRLESKKLVIDEEKAPILRDVFVKYVSGWGLRQIAGWLNDIGIRTKRGNPLENRTVEYWLNNPVYHGYIRWTPTGRTRRDYHNPDSIISKGSHEPIIDDDLWQKTQELLAERKARYVRNRRAATQNSYMLSGIIKCSNCGASLAKSSGQYLQCINYAKGACSVSHAATMPKLELMLISTIAADLASGDFKLERADGYNPQADTGALLKAQISKEKQKLLRIKEAFEAGIDTLAEYKENKARITAEIRRLESSIPTSEEITAKERRDFAEKHINTVKILSDSATSPRDKNALLKSFVKKVIYNKTENTLSVIYLR